MRKEGAGGSQHRSSLTRGRGAGEGRPRGAHQPTSGQQRSFCEESSHGSPPWAWWPGLWGPRVSCGVFGWISHQGHWHPPPGRSPHLAHTVVNGSNRQANSTRSPAKPGCPPSQSILAVRPGYSRPPEDAPAPPWSSRLGASAQCVCGGQWLSPCLASLTWSVGRGSGRLPGAGRLVLGVPAPCVAWSRCLLRAF